MSAWTADDGTRYALGQGGAGPTLLLLHGFTGRGADWDPFRAVLERHATLVTPDLLGHGASAMPSDPARHAVERQAGDLASLLAELDLAPAHVAGYSFGARVALRLAADHAALVRSLVLESPSPGIADRVARAERQAADERLARLLEGEGIGPFVDRWEALPLFATERSLAPGARAAIRAARLRNDPAGLAASLRGAGQGAMGPLHPILPAIGVPTTIIAGALDATGLTRARTVAAAVPSARLMEVEGAGHAVHREAPDRFARELARHLVSVSDICTPARSRP